MTWMETYAIKIHIKNSSFDKSTSYKIKSISIILYYICEKYTMLEQSHSKVWNIILSNKNLHTKYDINNFLGIKLFCMWQSDEDPSDLYFDQNFVSTGTWKKTESSCFKKLVKFYPFQ